MSAKSIMELNVDARLYPLEAVQAAAYTFTDRVFVKIAIRGENAFTVRLTPKEDCAAPHLLPDLFENELLHEALRLKISRANQKIREYVVTKALVSAQAPASAPAAASEGCPECPPQAENPPLDPALERDIATLLTEIENAGAPGADPLGVAVSWEEKYEEKAAAVAPVQHKSARKTGRKARSA